MIQNKIKTIFVALLFISFSVFAQSKELSLKESLNIGLKNSTEIKIAESKLNISNAQITKATSYLLPKLTFSGLYNHINIIDPSKFQLGPWFAIPLNNSINMYGGSVSLQQPLFTGFRFWAKRSAAKYFSKAVEEELNLQKNRKALEIQMAFWNFYKTQKIQAVIEDNLKAIEKHLEQTKQFLKNGLVTENDVLKLKVQMQNAKLKLVDAENAVAVAQITFNKTIGLKLNADTKIKINENRIIRNKYNYKQLLNKAINNRKELQILKYRQKASDKNITAAKSNWFPQIFATGNYYYYKINSDNFYNGSQTLKAWTVGLGLSWDIWNWGKTSAETEIAEEQKFQIQKNFRLLKRSIAIEVYRNFLRFKSEKKKIGINKLAVKSAELNYKIMNNKYNSHIATSTDLINAEAQLLEAQTNLAVAKADFSIAKVKLQFSVGQKIY